MRPFIPVFRQFLKDSLVLLVLRVLSLFNLQGTSPSASYTVRELHYSTPPLTCQALFSPFANLFLLRLPGSHPSLAFRELSHTTTLPEVCQDLFFDSLDIS